MSDFDIPPELRMNYIARRKSDLEKCKSAVQQNDFETLYSIGHQIKGNASTFGYDELALIAIDLEKFAHLKDVQKLDHILIRMAEFLSKM